MKRPTMKGLEQYAAKPVLVFSGSLLVLSVALNNIGFKEVIDAWAKHIAHQIEEPNKDLELKVIELEKRLKEVEKLAHHSGEK